MAHRLIGLLEVVELQPRAALHVSSSAIRVERVRVSVPALLRFRELELALRRGDLRHERRGRVEVEADDVQARGFLEVACVLVQLGCLLVLSHALEDLRALLADGRRAVGGELLHQRHASRQVTEPYLGC